MAVFKGTNNAPDTIFGGAEDDWIYGYDHTSASLGDAGDADFLYGGEGSDIIGGGEGDDLIEGGDGADYVYGDAGSDTINGGLGYDFCYGGDGNDTISTGGNDSAFSYVTDYAIGGGGDDVLLGGAGGYLYLSGDGGNDLLDASAGDASTQTNLSGGEGDDTIIGCPGSDLVFSDAGVDTIDTRGGDDRVYSFEDDGLDTLNGGDGNDFLYFSRQSVTSALSLDFSDPAALLALPGGGTFVNFEVITFWAGSGNDTLTASNGIPTYGYSNELYGGDGNDSLSASSNAANLIGGNGTDTLTGGAGDDGLYGGDDIDTVTGGAGKDFVEGGAGDDLFVASAALDGMDLYYGNFRPYYYYVYFGYEGVNSIDYSVLGASNSIVVSLDVGAAAAVSIAGGDVDIVFDIANITSGAGDDYIAGGYLTNRIDGRAGSDWLVGNGGADELLGGLGNDYLCIDHNDTLVDAGAGYDVIFIQDGTGTRLNVGAAHAEWIYSWIGDDVIDASSSSAGVFMAGEAGADILTGSAFDDIVFMDSFDTVDMGAGYDAMYVYLGTGQSVTGTTINAASAHAEWVKGGAGNDTIFNTGSSVSVSLSGGGGNDTLTGGTGSDYFYGNEGADLFVVTSNAQLDAVLDFASGSDHINVQATGFTSFAQILAASNDAGGSTLIDFGGGNQLLLYGFAIGGLNAADFVF